MANKAFLMGRLTRDCELKYTANNTAVANFTLAVNKKFKKEGEQQADFINIVAWDKHAEFCSKYFKKGMQVVVIGRIQTRTWEDDKGTKHYVTEIVSEEAYFADSKRSDNNSESSESTTPGFSPVDTEEDVLPF